MKDNVVNDLYDYGYKIVQNDEYFKFSIDSILLADFVNIKFSDKRLLDICTGNCPIPIILSNRIRDITAFEIQKDIYLLGKESLNINSITNVNLINDDIKNISNYFKESFFDIITCNPPYFKVMEKSKLNNCDIKSIARHEIKIKLDEILRISYKYLRDKGSLFIVYRTDRLIELIKLLDEFKFGIKKIQCCYYDFNSACSIVLVEAKKNGKHDLKINSPICVANYRKDCV